MCRDRRRRSLSDAVETVWKVSGTGQPPHHEPYHCGVDERLRACAQPLVVFAHPPVLPQPREGPLYHPPPRQGHVPLRRHEASPVHFLALPVPLPRPRARMTSSKAGFLGLRTTSTLRSIASSAHLLPLPSYPASGHR